MSAITALTAQNTVTVTGVHTVPPAFIVEQVRAVVEDIGVDAVKTGMLGDVATIDAVVEALDLIADDIAARRRPRHGRRVGCGAARAGGPAALVEKLLPRATVVTPNVPEARALVGEDEQSEIEALARR